eukprot:8705864-Pyramimonas_sp.AAC.1
MTVTDCGERVERSLFRHPSGHRSVSLIHCAPEHFRVPSQLLMSLPRGCSTGLPQDCTGRGSESASPLA